MSLQRTRDLIMAIHAPYNHGVTFDTDKAPELGYSASEIAFIERLLEVVPDVSLNKLIKSQLIFCSLDHGYDPGIVYIAIAKIIFIVDHNGKSCSYIFEEDLEQKVAETKLNMVTLAWAETNKNDSTGNNI